MEGRGYLGAIGVHWGVMLKMDLRNVSYKGVDWIELAQDRPHIWVFVNMVMNLWIS
jgi:hypothetical protein